MVFEVKGYNPTSKNDLEVSDIGWAFVPLFVAVENENKSYSLFTNSGLL